VQTSIDIVKNFFNKGMCGFTAYSLYLGIYFYTANSKFSINSKLLNILQYN